MFGLFAAKPTQPPLDLSPQAATLLQQLHESENLTASPGNATGQPAGDPLAPQNIRPKTREEKRAARIKKRDEKRRAKTRKKMTSARFSRARYLREAHGNAATRIIFWLMLGLVFLFGPVLLNSKFLLPQTEANLQIIAEIERLEADMLRTQPQLAAATAQKTGQQDEIQAQLSTLPQHAAAAAALEQFIADLKAEGARVNDAETKRSISDLGVANAHGQTIEIELDSDFLTYWKIRNKLVKSFTASHVAEETLLAAPDTTVMQIRLKLMLASIRG